MTTSDFGNVTAAAGSSEEEPFFWILQPDVMTGLRACGVFKCKLPIVGLFVRTIVGGAVMDKLTSDVNPRLINGITRSRAARDLPCLSVRDMDALFTATIMADAVRTRTHMFMPMRLLYYDVHMHKDAEMFNVQERVLYQMMHLWDRVGVDERRALTLRMLPEDQWDETTRDSVAQMAELDTESLLRMILMRRGHHLVESRTDCTHEPRREVAIAGGVARGTACKCGREYYQSVMVRDFHAKCVADPGMVDLAGFLAATSCATLQYTIALTLFALWGGIHECARDKAIQKHGASVRIAFRMRPEDHPLLRDDLGAHPLSGSTTNLLLCNHAQLRLFLLVMNLLSQGDSMPNDDSGTVLVTDLDATELRLHWSHDVVLTRWFDTLRRALQLALRVPAGGRKFMGLIREWSRFAGSMRLCEAVRWLCFDFIYLRNVRISVALDNDEHTVPPEFDGQWMTFGLVPVPDPEWRLAQTRIETLLISIDIVITEMQASLHQSLIAEEERTAPKTRRRRPLVAAPFAPWSPSGPEDEPAKEMAIVARCQDVKAPMPLTMLQEVVVKPPLLEKVTLPLLERVDRPFLEATVKPSLLEARERIGIIQWRPFGVSTVLDYSMSWR